MEDLSSKSHNFTSRNANLERAKNNLIDSNDNLKKTIRETIINIIDISNTLVKQIREISKISILKLKNLEKQLKLTKLHFDFNKKNHFDDYQRMINLDVIKKFKVLVFQKSRNLSPRTQENLRKDLEKLRIFHDLSDSRKDHQLVFSSLVQTTVSQLNHIDLEPIDSLLEYSMKNIVIFQLFFQFLRKPLPDDQEKSWLQIKEFLSSLKSTSCSRETVSEKVMKEVEKFDFSNENIDEIESIVKEKGLNIDEKDELAYVLIPFYYILKETCFFSGVFQGKGPISRQLSRIEYKLKLCETLNN